MNPSAIATQREELTAAYTELLRAETIASIRRRAAEEAQLQADAARDRVDTARADWDRLLGLKPRRRLDTSQGFILEELDAEDSADIWNGMT